jgi:hypothetical protein
MSVRLIKVSSPYCDNARDNKPHHGVLAAAPCKEMMKHHDATAASF